jgi:DNA repair photolyase
MNHKPVFEVPAKTVVNFKSAFEHKKLCDGLTFSLGSACAFSCTFCYVPDLMRKLRELPGMAGVHGRHEDIVIRRRNALDVLKSQLVDRRGRPKFSDPQDRRVIFASPLVDVAANLELAKETAAACFIILHNTNWQIRLLSKSHLLPEIAKRIPEQWKNRIIYGVSTGTIDDAIGRAVEPGTPLVSKRLASLHWLQDSGHRTFGMICPSLPYADSDAFSTSACHAIRSYRCEHVWGEALNVRGESMTRTVRALEVAGHGELSERLAYVSADKYAWEDYARETFLAHSSNIPGDKLRFLQYTNPSTRMWWNGWVEDGAVLL